MSQARTFSSFLLIIFSQIIPFSAALEPDPECADWFKKSKITAGTKDCEMGCATLMVDMATFNCPNQCEDLCRTKTNKSILESLIFYPGLTPAEKALIARKPKEALTVYRQMRTAETATLRNFPDQNLNDESDAFRHFVWAALLTKELGRSKAKQFLEAHENDPDQPDVERQMDLHNNSRGQMAAETLEKDNRWNQKNLESIGLNELRPGLPIPKEPK